MSPFSRNTDYREQNDFEEQVRDSSYPPILKRRMKNCHKLPSLNYIFSLTVYIQLHPKLLHEVIEGAGKTGQIETSKNNFFFFFNLVMEISVFITSLKSKEDFDGFCF